MANVLDDPGDGGSRVWTWNFNMAHNLIEQIRDLAALIASMPPGLSYATLRIAVVVGDALPWRIVESIANSMRCKASC